MRILSIIGARPQFVKAAVFRKHCLDNGIEEILVHTGQHYDAEMSTKIFDELGVKAPDVAYHLKRRTHGGMTGEMLANIEKTITDIKPSHVNVYGDTNSTLAGALAASKMHLPLIHIEAGLRSFNKRMPEEINRVLTDHMSDYLFCPTSEAVENLKNESIVKGVHLVGDIMFDAVKAFDSKFDLPAFLYPARGKELAVMTVHRAEAILNREKLTEIVNYCLDFSSNYQIIFPVHPNTRNKLKEFSIDTGAIRLIEPLSYLEMQGLLREAALVLTDSGGLQKEAYFHKCDCITLRDETEWVETIEAGWNKLWKSVDDRRAKSLIWDYGTGDATQKIFHHLSQG